MTVQDILDIYINEDNYIPNSLLNKSYDDYGCTYKWLCKQDNTAFRREIFIATEGTGTLEDRTVITYIEIKEVKNELKEAEMKIKVLYFSFIVQFIIAIILGYTHNN